MPLLHNCGVSPKQKFRTIGLLIAAALISVAIAYAGSNSAAESLAQALPRPR
jgi:hypothetical protein